MSSFGGTIPDLPDFSIDRFDGENLNSTWFFLSHCHSDHMKGLFSSEFCGLLEEKNYFVYMSPVSAAILRNLCAGLTNYIQELDPYSSTTISNVAVSTIPAAHCPGSVMFLFETAKKTILYTGDFRINPRHVTSIKALQNQTGGLKTIDVVYVDTTFFFEDYKWFPSREESLREICQIIKKWFSRSSSNTIQLHTSARYGYEFLFIEISRKFKMPIFISDKETFKFYSVIPEMDQAVTENSGITRISAGMWSKAGREKENVHSVRISAWKWRNASAEEGVSDGSSVCYSTHPSYEECCEFLKILKPKRIEANVVREETKEILHKNIQKCLQSFTQREKTENVETIPVKLFKIKEKETTNVSYEGYDSELLDSPPRKKVFI